MPACPSAMLMNEVLTDWLKWFILKKSPAPGTMFIPSVEDREELVTLLVQEFPYFNVSRSTLGGEERASIIVKVSLDPKEEWVNGIYHNSRYAMFHIGAGKIEQFNKSKTEKFRKCNAKSVEEAVNKIITWRDKH